jgi:hypothetical protein
VLRIAIVVVIDQPEHLANYALAQATLGCYSQFYGYQLHTIYLSANKTLLQACPQTDA